MGAATDILESEKRAAADSYGRDANGYPGMSGSFLIILINTWQGMMNDKADQFPLLNGFSQQLDYYRAYEGDFGLSASGPDVEKVWDTLATIAQYLDPLYTAGYNSGPIDAIGEKAKAATDALKGALDNLGNGLTTFATLAVVGLGLYLVVRLKGK